MDSKSLPQLPVIDFSREDLTPGTETWLSTAKQVCHALEEYGCFVINSNEVSLDLYNSLYRELQDLFALPAETKQRVKSTAEQPYRMAFSETPNQEGIVMDSIIDSEDAQNFAKLLWPDGNDRFCETAREISKIMKNLDHMVKRMVFQSYGVDKLYDSHLDSVNYVSGCFSYTEAEKNEKYVGMYGHTDKAFSSIIHQSDVNAVEAQTKDGQWILYDPPSHSSFLYLAADGFKVWSNNRIRSCFHRVVMSGSKPRISVGLFMLHKGMVHVADELVDEEHPLRFKPFDQREYYKLCIQYGDRTPFSIEAYCGIESQ